MKLTQYLQSYVPFVFLFCSFLYPYMLMSSDKEQKKPDECFLSASCPQALFTERNPEVLFDQTALMDIQHHDQTVFVIHKNKNPILSINLGFRLYHNAQKNLHTRYSYDTKKGTGHLLELPHIAGIIYSFKKTVPR